MVRNIQDTNEVLDPHTHGGMIRLTKKCEVPLFGQAWINPKSITNIISISAMADKYCVTFDSKNEDTFVVYLPTQDLKFKCINGSYYYKPTEIKKNIVKRNYFLLWKTTKSSTVHNNR